MQSQPAAFKLTPTVQKIRKKLAEEDEVSALFILQLLSSLHPKYGQGTYPDISGVKTSQYRHIDDWLQAVGELLNPDYVPELHGRLLLIGLVLIDSELARILLQNEFLRLLEDDFKEPLENLLLPDAYRQWRSLLPVEGEPGPGPVISPADYAQDNVPTHSDHPTIVDELGRRAFARALAHRIQRVKDNESWQHGKKPESLNFFSFVLGRAKGFSDRFFAAGSKEDPQKTTYSGAFMMHIHGPWGSGKTTLINFIRDELQSQPGGDRWLSVYFNAWKYQRLGPPWWALTKEVYLQALKQLEKSELSDEDDHVRAKYIRHNELWRRIFAGWGPWLVALGLIFWAIPTDSMDILNNFGKIVTLGGGLLAGGQFVLTGSAKGTSTMLEISGDPMGPLVKHFNSLILNTGHPVVIFIDDLDRCDAEYVIKLLHGIQTMYWNTQVAYVVAADRHWLRAAYEKTYEDFSPYVGEPGRPMGYLFLEKLFQLSTSVPKLDTSQVEFFWNRLIGISKETLDQEMLEARKRASETLNQQKTENDILNLTKMVNDDQQEDLFYKQAVREEAVVRLANEEIEQHTEHTLKAYNLLLEPNPRAMKRMVNAYAVRRAIDIISGGHVDRGILALWTIMELRWPLLAEYLTEYPQQVTTLRKRQIPKDNNIDEDLKKLFVADEVIRVINGEAEGVTAKLTAKTIQQCTGHITSHALSGTMA